MNQYLLPTDKIFDNLFISFEDSSLKVDINNIKYDSLPFITRNTLELIIGSNVSILLNFKIENNKLYIRTNLLGITDSIIQNIPGITSLILFFCPSLEKIKGLSYESTFDLIYDLDTILIKDNKLTEIIKFESLTTINNLLILNFSTR